MAESSFKRFYHRTEFTGLPVGSVDVEQLEVQLGLLGLSSAVVDVESLPDDWTLVEWAQLPSPADLQAVDDYIPSFSAGPTSSAPVVLTSYAASTTTSATPVDKLLFESLPLTAGVYHLVWNSTLRMQSLIANTGIQATVRVQRSDGEFLEQSDTWDRNFPHAYNGGVKFEVLAGQTISATLRFFRLGASNNAEISGARFSLDKTG
jgi:hypothetical protein